MSVASGTLANTMEPKGIIQLTEGNFYFGAPTEVPPGVRVERADTEPDRPTVVHYQEGVQPDFPLFIGATLNAPDMLCPNCSHVLATGLAQEEITGLFLECHCGDGLDLLIYSEG